MTSQTQKNFAGPYKKVVTDGWMDRQMDEQTDGRTYHLIEMRGLM